MKKVEINPFVRFLNAYPILPAHSPYSLGYDCRIFFIMNGTLYIKTENESFTVNKNCLIYIPAGVKYHISYPDSMLCEVLAINFDFTKKYRFITEPLTPVSSLNADPSKILSDTIPDEFSNIIFLECNQTLRSFFSFIYHESLIKTVSYDEKISALLKYMLLTIYSNNTLGHSYLNTDKLSEITKYILVNYSDNELTNTNLAKKFGYHPYYLSSLFRDSFGLTLHQYILNIRIESSKELLRHTNLSIGEISNLTGFNSSSYFTQKFKHTTGVTPLSYRQSNKHQL